MRIISPYKDYYDFAQDYQDEVIYHRKPEKTIIKYPNEFYNIFEVMPYFGGIYTNEKLGFIEYLIKEIGVICIAGTFHPYIVAILTKKDKSKWHYVFYSLESFEELLGERVGYGSKNYKDFFNLSNTLSKDLFLKIQSPVFIIANSFIRGYEPLIVDPFATTGKVEKILYNHPILEKYYFYVIKDGCQTYQDIDMFLNNELVQDKIPDPTNTSPIHRMASRFGDKYSFRRMPEVK